MKERRDSLRTITTYEMAQITKTNGAKNNGIPEPDENYKPKRGASWKAE